MGLNELILDVTILNLQQNDILTSQLPVLRRIKEGDEMFKPLTDKLLKQINFECEALLIAVAVFKQIYCLLYAIFIKSSFIFVSFLMHNTGQKSLIFCHQ